MISDKYYREKLRERKSVPGVVTWVERGIKKIIMVEGRTYF